MILNDFWSLTIIPDSVTEDTQSVTKTYEETEYVMQPVVTCDEDDCTTTYQLMAITTTHEYTEKTTITYNDKNFFRDQVFRCCP